MKHPAYGHPFLGIGTGGASGSAMRMISVRTAWKSWRLFEVRAPATFSQHIHRGRMSAPVRPAFRSSSLISFVMRICSLNRQLRSSARPSRFPAMLIPWQGLPPEMMFTLGIDQPWRVMMLPSFRQFGKLRSVTRIGRGSTSLSQRGSIPKSAPANSKPPDPLNSEPRVRLLISDSPSAGSRSA